MTRTLMIWICCVVACNPNHSSVGHGRRDRPRPQFNACTLISHVNCDASVARFRTFREVLSFRLIQVGRAFRAVTNARYHLLGSVIRKKFTRFGRVNSSAFESPVGHHLPRKCSWISRGTNPTQSRLLIDAHPSAGWVKGEGGILGLLSH